MSSRAIALLCALCGVLTLAGCGSMQNQNFMALSGTANTHRVYGGVRNDLEIVGTVCASPVTDIADGRWDKAWESMFLAPFALGYAMIDVPLCLLIDTITLPADVIHTVGEWQESSSEEEAEDEKPVEKKKD